MGFVTIGIFSFTVNGISGAMVQIISHGIVSSGLFLVVGVLYDRTHTKNIADYGGVAKIMPKFAVMFMILTMASVGLPGTSGFVGEFLALLGVYSASKLTCILAASGIVLGAYYMLLLYKKVMLGKTENILVTQLTDINFRETMIFLILTCLVLLIGIYPKILTTMFNVNVLALVQKLNLGK